jgi:hypothetical protein
MDFNKISDRISNIQLNFITVIGSLFLIIGIFGNVYSILVFKSKEFRKQPITVYIIASCLINIISIFYLPIMFLAPIWIINEITCKLFPGFFGLVLKVQAWVEALGSLDRLISTLNPYILHFKNRLKFQIIFIFIIVLIILSLGLPEIIYLKDILTEQNVTVCSYPVQTEIMWIFSYYKIEYFLTRVFFPFSIMLFSSICITWKMFKSKNNVCPYNRNRQKEVNLFKSLLAFNLFFILFRIPMLVYLMTNNNTETFFNSFAYAILLATGLISNVFFFLIMIIFNSVYRKVFIKKFKLKCRANIFSKHIVRKMACKETRF